MNKRKRLTIQRWVPYTLVLVLLAAISLAGCKPTPTQPPTAAPTLEPTPTQSPTATPEPPTPTPAPPLPPPEAPATDPPGPEITVPAGKRIAVRASATGAAGYHWGLQGDGEISATEGDAILYIAPEEAVEGGTMALLTVTAYNDQGESPQTSLVINVTVPHCPSADAEGTIPPAVAISSIIFIVNGVEQVVGDADALQASPGDEVQVREVTICPVEPFGGGGGNVYVEFDPVDQNGQVIGPEIIGTRGVGVTSGFTSIPGPDHTWTIGDWRQISVVSVHYPVGGGTQNPDCEGGLCEVDDRVIVPIQ